MVTTLMATQKSWKTDSVLNSHRWNLSYDTGFHLGWLTMLPFYPWLILIGTFRFMNNFTESYHQPPSLDCCGPFELYHTYSFWSVLCFFPWRPRR